jgi:hypothetical protein
VSDAAEKDGVFTERSANRIVQHACAYLPAGCITFFQQPMINFLNVQIFNCSSNPTLPRWPNERPGSSFNFNKFPFISSHFESVALTGRISDVDGTACHRAKRRRYQ